MLLNKLSMATAGAAVIATMGVISAPAQATLLDFNYTTIQGGSGSFTLDTNVVDTNSASSSGFYPKAISNFTIKDSQLKVSQFESLDLNVREESYNTMPVTGLGILYDLDQPQPKTFGMHFTGKSLIKNVSGSKTLSDDPSAYVSTFGGGIVGGPVDNVVGGEVIDKITVTLHPDNNTRSVSEPSATIGILAIGALGTGSLLKRNMKRKGFLTKS